MSQYGNPSWESPPDDYKLYEESPLPDDDSLAAEGAELDGESMSEHAVFDSAGARVGQVTGFASRAQVDETGASPAEADLCGRCGRPVQFGGNDRLVCEGCGAIVADCTCTPEA